MARWDGVTLEDRFWSKVTKTDDCWLWTGCTQSAGYGQLWLDGKVRLAHRVSYEMHCGAIDPSVEIDHKTTCPKNCVRPEHLRPATHKQNLENVDLAAHNTSGTRGVSWYARDQKWKASVCHHGKQIHLGYFDTVEAAAAVVLAKRRELFTHNDIDRLGA